MTEAPTLYVCGCCEYSEVHPDPESARDAGWHPYPWRREDDPVVCALCPGVLVRLQRTDRHHSAHVRWAKYGRDKTFTDQFAFGDLPSEMGSNRDHPDGDRGHRP